MFNTAKYRELLINKFGGLFTEADPRDLPMGSSPQCWDVDFLIAGIGTRPGLNRIAPFATSVQWLKSATVSLNTAGPVKMTVMQDSGGSLWNEALTSPGFFTQFYSGILNNARAISETVNQREYIALSDLTQGLDQPRQWTISWLDRISQVGPGSGPSVPTVANPSYPIFSINEIYPSHVIDSVVWGSFPNTNNAPPPAPTIFFMGAGGDANFLLGLNIGDNVYVSGVGNLEAQNPNGTYTVTALGDYTDGNGLHQYFQVSASVSNGDFIRGSSGGTYQQTVAIVQLSSPIPQQDAVVGMQIAISGSSVQGWNSTWTIVATPTEGQLSISSTSLTSNVATYDYSVISGEAPGWQQSFEYSQGSEIVVAGSRVWQVTTPGTSGGSMPSFASSPQTDGGVTWTEQAVGVILTVTVFNTANGNGIFNVQNATITSANATSFTVAITSPNISSVSEEGEAVSGSGTALIIDPGLVTLNSGNPGVSPIYGSATGGFALPTTDVVAPGQRYAVCMFLTRNGYITPASPPVSFYTTGSSASLTFQGLPIGPPNVIARIVAFTAANAGAGGPFFWIPKDVIVQGSVASLGQTQTVNKTIIYDNVSTSLGPITISDAVLLASTNISVEGNNLQQQRELGECVKTIQFAGRVFYLGERTKVDQFVNMTFDGGSVAGFPAGWTISSGLSPYVSLIPSQIFGQSLQISNTSGGILNSGGSLSSQLTLSQTAYQVPILLSPIIQAATAYSVRITAASGSTSGSLVVELYSPGLSQNWPVSIPLASMGANLKEFVAVFNNPLWQPVPTDLQFRVYPSALPNNGYVVVDRIEPFATIQPVYTTQVAASYLENTEAIDAITGAVSSEILSSQTLTNHELFLNKYYLTSASKTFAPIQTTAEPEGWDVEEISNEAGCFGPLASDVGEEYWLTAGDNGVYLFDGGNHVKISQEIQQIWSSIYEPSKSTVWIRNDISNRRIMVGIPLPTPNQFLPNAPANPTPATPNVILMCSYLGMTTGLQIAEGQAVVTSAFTGRLIFHDGRRKWTLWQIPSAYSDFILQPNGEFDLWFGQQGLISVLSPVATSDNGIGIQSHYITFGEPDNEDRERFQMGQSRITFAYATATIEGSGKWLLTVLPETIKTVYPATQPPFSLSNPTLDDTNIPLNTTGNRAFFQFDSDGKAGTTWSLTRVDIAATTDQRIMVTGR